MKATQQLHDLGQSLWLDNITRDLLNKGTLKKYIEELSVTGLTSNPTIFNHAIKNSPSYDVKIKEGLQKGRQGEELFFDLALEDITAAADLFRRDRRPAGLRPGRHLHRPGGAGRGLHAAGSLDGGRRG